MIFVDTNYLLRLVLQPQTEYDRRMTDTAARLFRSAHTGLEQITTSDAVLAEVFWVLNGPTYKIPKQDISRALRPILSIRGMHSSSKDIWLETLEILEARPQMKFVDALAAAYSLVEEMDLATFDRKLARYPGLSLYSPETG
jgi:predicted nucleic acid-binding protein